MLTGDGLKPSSAILKDALELRRELVDARRDKKDGEADSAKAVGAALKLPAIYRPVYIDEAFARFSHAVTTDRPFLERLTQFWSNHFAVSIDKIAVLGIAGAMEREAIRPHVTGSFTRLLMAVEKHPAMLLYLDNQTSIGPNSRAAKFIARRGKGNGRKLDINENLAREILELHTLGVDGGYTQTDVTTFAKAISGWSIGGEDQGRRFARLGLDSGKPGEFFFREVFHEPGAKRLLGKSYGEDGVKQGEAILEDLAQRPETARHISTKLARHFIADDPPTGGGGTHDPVPGSRVAASSRRSTPRCSHRRRPGASRWRNSRRRPTTSIPRTARSRCRCATNDARCRPSRRWVSAISCRARRPAGPTPAPTGMDPPRCSSALPGRTVVAQRMGDERNARELAPRHSRHAR